jgi:hypothetical protein
MILVMGYSGFIRSNFMLDNLRSVPMTGDMLLTLLKSIGCQPRALGVVKLCFGY